MCDSSRVGIFPMQTIEIAEVKADSDASKKNWPGFHGGYATRIYPASPDDPKITIESYLAAGRPLHTKTGLLYGSDALAYIRGNSSQKQQEPL